MKIGIIVCDIVDPVLSSEFGEFADMIQQGLAPFSQHDYLLFNAMKDELPQTDDGCDAYIITGSTYDAYADLPWINALAAWIRKCDMQHKPLLGICFGHQIIALALGGRVEKSSKGWGVGLSSDNKINIQLPWMKPEKSALELLVFHQDQVISLPSSMKAIVSSEFCPNYMLTKGKHILTVQGHPEFTVDFERCLLGKMREAIGDEHYIPAISSLNSAPDSSLVMRWFCNFLNEYEPRLHQN
ncbi:gamma-glutamyl-gamma-aminobutyrate hydrolase family protein [Vibrio sp. JC009]|uniref:glutamine amidotransferase-related protein n=1 Tax=Vibrio sp. JC009 TaxID=2912314 RepID=UPI0023AE921D|nr:gamma-glutamyl-gamma-aminobutyrate hydrolase family protein [Vibrio sp. JC009]WED23352.1 gamma-glutamyl-gamma-aminobutyrate hydrolase family protein [Vibrio sp. JC009]